MNCSSLLNIYTFLAILLFSTLYLTWNAYDASYCILSDSLIFSASVNGYYVGSQNDGSYSRKDYINILFKFPDFFQLHELKSTTSTASSLYPSDYYIITKIQIKSDGNANDYLWGIVHLEPSKSTMIYVAYNDKMTGMYEKSFPPTTGWTYLLPEVMTAEKRRNENDYRNHTSSFHFATATSTSTDNNFMSVNYMRGSNTEDIINTKRYVHNTNTLYTPTLSGSISTSTLTCTCYGTASVISKNNSNRKPSNIYLMLHHPITTLFIIIMCYIAFYIWQNHIDTSILTLSYDNIFTAQQYYRIITASVCHFDLLHLGFNMYALYQLMEVESVYNSVKYAYLSIDLIFITVAIYLLIYHVLITKFNQVNLIHSSVVGYSGVVFAWMVAYSATLKQFCPIMFFPSLCFSTYYIIPGFSINLAPILLLFITKLIIPQSSFTGHLAGIIIGYPLTWGLLNWCTPPLLITILSIGFVRMKTLYFWKINVYSNDQTNSVLVINDSNNVNVDDSNYDRSSNNNSTTNSTMTRLFKCIRPYISPTDMANFIPNTANNTTELNMYYSFISTSLAFLFVLCLSIFTAPWQQLLPRALLILLVYGTWQYRRCMYLSDRSSSNAVITEQALVWFGITLSVVLCFIFLDSWSFASSLVNRTYLTSNSSSSSTQNLSFYYYSICSYAFLIVNEGIYICHLSALLHHHSQADALLKRCRLDWSQLKGVLQPLCCSCGCNYCSFCDLNSSTGNNVRRTYGRGTLLPTTDTDERNNGASGDNDNIGNMRSTNSKSKTKAVDKTKHNMAVLKDRLKHKGNGNGTARNSGISTSTADRTINDSGSYGVDTSIFTSSSSNHFNYTSLSTATIDDDGNHNINCTNNNNNAKQKTKTSPAPSNINNDNGDNDTFVV